MADDTFRNENAGEGSKAEQNKLELDKMAAMRASVAEETSNEHNASAARDGGAVEIKGNMPPALQQAIKEQSGSAPTASTVSTSQMKSQNAAPSTSGGLLENLLSKVRDTRIYEPLTLPSKGKFYDGENGPLDGVIHIRPMTGEEEQILATPRFVRKGHAIDMIFKKCMQENFPVEQFLTVDRTYLLIYLRGISYSPEYEVEIKCPSCDTKFSTVLDLNSLFVDFCEDDFGNEDCHGELPTSGYSFKYRLSTGQDETQIQEYRDRRIKQFGDQASDDSLTYRSATLLHEIEGLEGTAELLTLVKNLPISDVTHLRNTINEPPFGVDTMVGITCASCLHEFEVDLPLESNFFFPKARKKVEKTQV